MPLKVRTRTRIISMPLCLAPVQAGGAAYQRGGGVSIDVAALKFANDPTSKVYFRFVGRISSGNAIGRARLFNNTAGSELGGQSFTSTVNTDFRVDITSAIPASGVIYVESQVQRTSGDLFTNAIMETAGLEIEIEEKDS